MGSVKIDLSGFKKYQNELAKRQAGIDGFFDSCAKELAARLLAKVIKRTPVGETVYEVEDLKDEGGNALTYKRGKNKGQVKQKKTAIHNGGTLWRGWTSKTEQEAMSGGGQDVVSFAQALTVEKVGGNYRITIINPVSYASYVEYGHRQTPGRYVPQIGKRLKKGWVDGQFMLTIAEMELKTESLAILERKLAAFLRGAMDGE